MTPAAASVLRIGRTTLLLDADAAASYLEFHREVWAGVEQAFRAHGIRDYSIFLLPDELRLFSFAEYHGTSYEVDMAALGADPECLRWSALCARFQAPDVGSGWERLTEVWSLPA